MREGLGLGFWQGYWRTFHLKPLESLQPFLQRDGATSLIHCLDIIPEVLSVILFCQTQNWCLLGFEIILCLSCHALRALANTIWSVNTVVPRLLVIY